MTAPTPKSSLGLPTEIRACLFDLDGVLTQTAKVHCAAWKEIFDEFLEADAAKRGIRFTPFDPIADYDQYVDGKPRLDGVRSFLASRGIVLPEGAANDPSTALTVVALGRKKNDVLLKRIEQGGVEAYQGSVRFVHAARAAGLPCGVVSSSANCQSVLAAVGIEHLFQARIDGKTIVRDHLPGKPAPDTFLAGARALNVPPDQAAVFEDALAGVQAGRAGGFGWVVGVDRAGQAAALLEYGADQVVRDLAELLEQS